MSTQDQETATLDAEVITPEMITKMRQEIMDSSSPSSSPVRYQGDSAQPRVGRINMNDYIARLQNYMHGFKSVSEQINDYVKKEKGEEFETIETPVSVTKKVPVPRTRQNFWGLIGPKETETTVIETKKEVIPKHTNYGIQDVTDLVMDLVENIQGVNSSLRDFLPKINEADKALDRSIDQAIRDFGSSYRIQKSEKQAAERLQELNQRTCQQINSMSWDDPNKDELLIHQRYLEKDISVSESERISRMETAILKDSYLKGLNTLQKITQHTYNEAKRWNSHFDNFITGISDLVVVSDNVYQVAQFVSKMCEFMVPATRHVATHVGATDKIYRNCFVKGGLKPDLEAPVDTSEFSNHVREGRQKLDSRAKELSSELGYLLKQKCISGST